MIIIASKLVSLFMPLFPFKSAKSILKTVAKAIPLKYSQIITLTLMKQRLKSLIRNKLIHDLEPCYSLTSSPDILLLVHSTPGITGLL